MFTIETFSWYDKTSIKSPRDYQVYDDDVGKLWELYESFVTPKLLILCKKSFKKFQFIKFKILWRSSRTTPNKNYKILSTYIVPLATVIFKLLSTWLGFDFGP